MLSLVPLPVRCAALDTAEVRPFPSAFHWKASDRYEQRRGALDTVRCDPPKQHTLTTRSMTVEGTTSDFLALRYYLSRTFLSNQSSSSSPIARQHF